MNTENEHAAMRRAMAIAITFPEESCPFAKHFMDGHLRT
jgi:hypothetical protein